MSSFETPSSSTRPQYTLAIARTGPTAAAAAGETPVGSGSCRRASDWCVCAKSTKSQRDVNDPAIRQPCWWGGGCLRDRCRLINTSIELMTKQQTSISAAQRRDIALNAQNSVSVISCVRFYSSRLLRVCDDFLYKSVEIVL